MQIEGCYVRRFAVNSEAMRLDHLFLRNDVDMCGKYGIPVIKKQHIDLDGARLISYSNTRANDTERNKQCGVHFFIDDYRFGGIYNAPMQSWPKLSQYSFLLSPDFSLYSDMPIWKQIENTAKNRWCGAWWQKQGAKVIPTVSWAGLTSFEFCFDGIECGSIVAIGTIGCRKVKKRFMLGYNEMLRRIEPEKIIVFGKPFDEMNGDLVVFDYLERGD